MRRAVLDTSVFVSALITPAGTSAKLLEEARAGELELIVSPQLLVELEDVLVREKFRRYLDLGEAREFLDVLRREATVTPDPEGPPPLRSADPEDDYLIALAYSQSARLVSGDSHLLDLADVAPICSPADFLVGLPA
ncbi:MAG TPA: putative toxin-antitoxin system toxin component, PIN family [Solirubrobacterales bacterium]|nr:putative toxin-antitoxin system toxin component, PIN family [Solirubrobacterales bacterium]